MDKTAETLSGKKKAPFGNEFKSTRSAVLVEFLDGAGMREIGLEIDLSIPLPIKSVSFSCRCSLVDDEDPGSPR